MDDALDEESDLAQLLVFAAFKFKRIEKELSGQCCSNRLNVLITYWRLAHVLYDNDQQLEAHVQRLEREKLRTENLLHGSLVSCRVILAAILAARLKPDLQAIAHCFAHHLCHEGAFGHRLPALAIDRCLVAVVALVVADDVVAIRVVFVEGFVGILNLALLALLDDIVGVKHGLMLAFSVEAELLFAACIRLRSRELNHCLSELIRLKIVVVAGFFNCINRGVCTLTEQYMHDLATQVRTQH